MNETTALSLNRVAALLAEADAHRVEIPVRPSGTGRTTLLLDVSGSMADPARGPLRRIDLLERALAGVRDMAERVIAFGGARDGAEDVTAAFLAGQWRPRPWGGTPLDEALEVAAQGRPGHVLVISDGEPNDEDRALDVAQRLACVIDVLYVGPEGNTHAIDFMRRLAAAGRGTCTVHDLQKQDPRALPAVLKGLLPARKPSIQVGPRS